MGASAVLLLAQLCAAVDQRAMEASRDWDRRRGAEQITNDFHGMCGSLKRSEKKFWRVKRGRTKYHGAAISGIT
jgi:hypothetical protein